LSYGQTTLMHILHEEVNGQEQGGAVRFPWHFYSGAMRARFNPADGQLHVCDNGVEISFAEKLKKETVEDAGNWSVEAWNYRWTSNYGSKEYKMSSPNEIGREALD